MLAKVTIDELEEFMTARFRTTLLVTVLVVGMLGIAGSAAASAGKTTGGSAPVRSQTVIFDMDQGMPSSVSDFNPYDSNQDNGLAQAVYEPLFISNVSSGQLVPWLAKSFTPNA